MNLEGGIDDWYLAFQSTMYREPDPDSLNTDVLWNVRAIVGDVWPMGRGMFTAGPGGRLVCIAYGPCAIGGDLALGARVLPARPFILSGDASIGGAKWTDGGPWILVTEYHVGAAVAVGRMEIGAGWHWLKLGPANAFGGPTLTARVWF